MWLCFKETDRFYPKSWWERETGVQAQVALLTRREREVLDGMACGYSNKTIAYDLGLSPRTVEVYRPNAMEKLGVASFADALRIAFGAGLGSEQDWRRRYSVGDSRMSRPTPMKTRTHQCNRACPAVAFGPFSS